MSWFIGTTTLRIWGKDKNTVKSFISWKNSVTSTQAESDPGDNCFFFSCHSVSRINLPKHACLQAWVSVVENNVYFYSYFGESVPTQIYIVAMTSKVMCPKLRIDSS